MDVLQSLFARKELSARAAQELTVAGMARKAALAGLLLLAAALGVQSRRVLLVDSRSGSYLNTQRGLAKISKPALQGGVAALTGLLPAYDLTEDDSQQIGDFLKPNPYKAPKCHLVLNVAGLTADEVLEALSGRGYLTVEPELEEQENLADAVNDWLDRLAGSNPDVPLIMLDQAAVQGCDGADCLSSQLDGVARAVGGQRSSSGSLMLGDGVELDPSAVADQLFATELASLFGGISQLQAAAAQREQDIQLLQMSLVGLQGLASKYGADAKAVSAGKAATQQLLSWALQQLDEVFDGDVTMQVAAVDGVPGSSFDDAIEWKERARSRLLQAVVNATTNGTSTSTPAWLQGDQTLQAQIFSAKAAGYGGFILLLYFLLAGIYCMCYMPIKKDTLLFGAKKNDL